MKQPKNNDLIEIRDVPKLIYKLTGLVRGRSAIYGWIKDGRVTYGGERIKLRTVRPLGHLHTTQKWVEEFLEKL